MSSIRSASSSTRNWTLSRRTVPRRDDRASARRGGQHVHARAQVIQLPAVTDAAIDDGDFQIGEARKIAVAFHLRGEFARRFEMTRGRARAVPAS